MPRKQWMAAFCRCTKSKHRAARAPTIDRPTPCAPGLGLRVEPPQFRRARRSIFAGEFGILGAKPSRGRTTKDKGVGAQEAAGSYLEAVRLDMAAHTQRVFAASKTTLRGDAGLWMNKGTLNRPTVRVPNKTPWLSRSAPHCTDSRPEFRLTPAQTPVRPARAPL